ncbi:hypothetical protein RFI_12344, partial [Reticulomyxa filosa]
MSSTPDPVGNFFLFLSFFNEIAKADAWVSLMLQKGYSVSAVDLIQKYGIDPLTAQSILARFESRRTSKGQANKKKKEKDMRRQEDTIRSLKRKSDSKESENKRDNQDDSQSQVQNEKMSKPTENDNVSMAETANDITTDDNDQSKEKNRKNIDPLSEKEEEESTTAELPLGWAKLEDQDGYYYFNVLTQQKTRQKPDP